MNKLNLTASNDYEEIVKKYLEENASESLIEKINNGSKTLSGFFEYAKNGAHKRAVNNYACIADKEVFGWAIHYFEEDSIKEGQSNNKPAAEKKPQAKPVEKKTVSKKQDNQQLDFFAMLGDI